MAETYTSLDRVKLYIFNDIADPEFNFLLINLITEASVWMQNEMGDRRVFDTGVDEVEIYDGDFDSTGRDSISLRSWPLVSITSVEERTGSLGNPTWVTISADNYAVDEESGILYFDTGSCIGNSRLPAGRRNVRVTYRGGHPLDFGETGDLVLCANKMVAKEFDKRNSQGVTQESVGGGTVSWNEDIDPSAERIFRKYRRF